ncbi:MAG: DUF167 domain-containing protein [Alphaproteobacteria bacterium]
MKIFVKVTQFSKKDEIISDEINLFGARQLKIEIPNAPIDGKVNKSLVEFLANYLEISKKLINISSGLKSRNKITEIIEN